MTAMTNARAPAIRTQRAMTRSCESRSHSIQARAEPRGHDRSGEPVAPDEEVRDERQWDEHLEQGTTEYHERIT